MVAPYRPHEDLEAAPLLEGDLVILPPIPVADHEYHEISDDEASNSPRLDLGPSLMAEMELMFSSLGQQPLPPPSPVDHESSNKSNELRERLAKPRKQAAAVKPISAHDQKKIDTIIALVNEYSTKSFNVPTPTTPSSPNKRKFSFRFPSVTDHEKQSERRNFSEEVQSTPDLQVIA